MKRFIAMSAIFLWMPLSARAADPQEAKQRRNVIEALTGEMESGGAIELKALEIRAKIYEPSVIYILDHSRLEIDYRESDVRFSDRIREPILENLF